MNVLTVIMATSAAFAVLSIALCAIVFARRIMLDFKSQRNFEEMQALTDLVIGYVNGEDLLDKLLEAIGRAHPDIATQVLDKVQRLVTGQAHERLALALASGPMVEILIHQLETGTSQKRIRALDLLSNTTDTRAISVIRGQMKSRHPDVRLAAAVTLAGISAFPSVRDLLDQLKVDTKMQSSGLYVLFRKLLPKHLLELIDVLHSDESAYVKALAIDALGHHGDYKALQTLILFTESDQVELRLSALKALASLGHPGAWPAVARALADPQWAVRVQAVNAARAIDLTDLAPALEALLEDSNWWVRFRSAQGLAEMGEPGVKRLKAASRKHNRAGETSRQVLAETGLS